MNNEDSMAGKRSKPRLQPRRDGSYPGIVHNPPAQGGWFLPNRDDRPAVRADGTGEGTEQETIPEPERGRKQTSIWSPPVQGGQAGNRTQGFSEDAGPKDRAVRRGVSDDDVRKAKALFSDIGQRFNENRKKSKASAYEQYQRDLMENMDTLVLGEVITLKEITATITDLEVFMRNETGDAGKSQAQLLAEWLTVPTVSSAALEESDGK